MLRRPPFVKLPRQSARRANRAHCALRIAHCIAAASGPSGLPDADAQTLRQPRRHTRLHEYRLAGLERLTQIGVAIVDQRHAGALLRARHIRQMAIRQYVAAGALADHLGVRRGNPRADHRQPAASATGHRARQRLRAALFGVGRGAAAHVARHCAALLRSAGRRDARRSCGDHAVSRAVRRRDQCVAAKHDVQQAAIAHQHEHRRAQGRLRLSAGARGGHARALWLAVGARIRG